jgi:hypothetical protein
MPECIVCKGYYEEGQRCGRCGSDNEPWVEWLEAQDEEQEGVEGLLAFTAPHFYLPFLIVSLAVPFGLMGMGVLWRGTVPAAQLLAVVLTICSCLIAVVAGYGARHEIREKGLLRRVRRGWRASLSGARARAIIVPAFSILLVLLILVGLIKSDMLWDLARWFLLDPAYLELIQQQEATSDAPPEGEEPEGAGSLLQRIRQVLPLVLMGGYVVLMISFTYSSSLLLALVYANKLNAALPQPIFLQDEKLAQIVRRDAEVKLGRDPRNAGLMNVIGYIKIEGQPGPEIIGLAPDLSDAVKDPKPPQAELWSLIETWLWDEMARTDDGGIEMKVARQEVYRPSELTEKPGPPSVSRVRYTVRADPWGRITEIRRDAG